jgi:FixJ family two-component response regulator
MKSEPAVYVLGGTGVDRDGICRLVHTVGLRAECFDSTESFLDHYNPDIPGCVVAHVYAADADSLQVQAKLAHAGHRIPVILLTEWDDMAMAVRAMRAGAVSVLRKPLSNGDLPELIHEAIAKDKANRRVQARVTESRRRLARLTPREREVLKLVVRGKANKEVAASLSVSEKTVEIHRAHVKKKLQAQSIAALVRMVLLGSTKTEDV